MRSTSTSNTWRRGKLASRRHRKRARPDRPTRASSRVRARSNRGGGSRRRCLPECPLWPADRSRVRAAMTAITVIGTTRSIPLRETTLAPPSAVALAPGLSVQVLVGRPIAIPIPSRPRGMASSRTGAWACLPIPSCRTGGNTNRSLRDDVDIQMPILPLSRRGYEEQRNAPATKKTLKHLPLHCRSQLLEK